MPPTTSHSTRGPWLTGDEAGRNGASPTRDDHEPETGIDQAADTTDTVDGYPHNVYRDAAGNALVETYSITGMGHGYPIDPGTGPLQCGVAAPYILDVNICASYYIAQWFGVTS